MFHIYSSLSWSRSFPHAVLMKRGLDTMQLRTSWTIIYNIISFLIFISSLFSESWIRLRKGTRSTLCSVLLTLQNSQTLKSLIVIDIERLKAILNIYYDSGVRWRLAVEQYSSSELFCANFHPTRSIVMWEKYKLNCEYNCYTYA